MSGADILVKSRESLLTTSSGYTNYRGILNLVIILLVLSNARAALENVLKYGILVDPFSWLGFFTETSRHTPAILIGVGLGGHMLISLVAERVLAPAEPAAHANGAQKQGARQAQLVPRLAGVAIVVNLICCIAAPPALIHTNQTHPISSSLALMLVSVVFLKLVSYHMMNFWCRELRLAASDQSATTRAFLRSAVPAELEFEPAAKRHHDEPNNNNNNSNNQELAKERLREQTLKQVMSRYPANLTLDDLLTFMSFPTLCYELQWARTRRLRKRFLVKRLVELLVLAQVDMALVQQWIVPTVSNSVLPFRQMQLSHMLERLLKLAVPNHVIWLIWFYMFFHSLLNIAAELTRYADRQFYRDWWNSESVYYFWSNWNVPVHKWCARHLYIPLMALGLTRCQASTAVFFVSAFFHEYLVSVPLKMFRMWAFAGMLIQLPLARFVSNYFNHNFANVAVWVSLIIGQPLCILMYYHDYYVINQLNQSVAPG